jgi:Beta-propeller repeat
MRSNMRYKWNRLFGCLCILATCSVSAAQRLEWLTQFDAGASESSAQAVVLDGAGGALVAGEAGDLLLSLSSHNRDVFVARFDAQGQRLWLHTLDSGADDAVNAAAPDGAGGAFVIGTTMGSLAGTNAGSADAFLVRNDRDGNLLWVRQFGTSGVDVAADVAPDGAGGVIIAGRTTGDLGGPNAGRDDAFIVRYDGDGNQLWVRQFGTPMADMASALMPDGTGGVWVTGATSASLARTNLTGFPDVFLARYDNAGNELWIRQMGTRAEDQGVDLASDGAGGVFMAGTSNGNIGPGTGTNFLARWNAGGSLLWLNQDEITRRSIAPDGEGGLMAAEGFFVRIIGFIVGGQASVTHYDQTGTRLWSRPIETGSFSAALDIAADASGNATVVGFAFDAWVARFEIDSCYADCDQSTGAGVLDIFDFLCFQNSFVNGASYACDCDTSTGVGVCDIFDFLCFQNAFVAGCP